LAQDNLRLHAKLTESLILGLDIMGSYDTYGAGLWDHFPAGHGSRCTLFP
jgi:hypothetical protein